MRSINNYKLSYYNILVHIPVSDEYISFNTSSGGLHIFDGQLGRVLQKLESDLPLNEDDAECFDKNFIQLIDTKILVPEGIDEQQELFDFYDKKRASSIEKENSTISLTIGTTINCNMGCPYCFQFTRPKHNLKGDTVDQIIHYLDDMMEKSPVQKWRSLQLTWFGGEPLVNKAAITSLTPKLLEFCERHNISYGANIITNGILLSEEMWKTLEEHQVDSVQVTIDGSQEIHDINRPLKIDNDDNYTKILSNLANIPDKLHVNIRMNFDRKVVRSLPTFFNDLAKYNVWPRQYNRMSFTPAWLRTYEGEDISDEERKNRYTNEEFFDELQNFRKVQLKLFNDWAIANNRKTAKLQWTLPELQHECPTWASPYGVVVDPQGFIHKCWETFHETENNLGHVSEGYDVKKLDHFINYNRAELNDECSSCKYLPVCDQLSCAHQTENEEKKPPCTYWRAKTTSSIHDQYTYMLQNPEMMVFPQTTVKENSGHSNK